MRHRLVGCVMSLFGLSACTGPSFDILDAASEYDAHAAALNLSVSKISGTSSIRTLRQEIGGYLDFDDVMIATKGEGKVEAVNITLYSYGLSISGRKVGLLYRKSYRGSDFEQDGARYFEVCGEAALEAFQDPDQRVRAVYCRIDDHWLAYQISS